MGKQFELPILPLRGVVAFPGLVLPLIVKEKAAIGLVDDAVAKDKKIALFAMKPEAAEETADNLYPVGTMAVVAKLLRFPDGSVRFLTQSVERVKINKVVLEQPYIKARVSVLGDKDTEAADVEALSRLIKDQFIKMSRIVDTIPEEAQVTVMNVDSPSRLADMIAANMNFPVKDKQELLETLSVKERLERLNKLLNKEIMILELTQNIKKEAEGEMERNQREYILRQQLSAIKKELGMDEEGKEVEHLRKRVEDAKLPQDAYDAAMRELDRLDMMNQASAEYIVSRTYVEWLVDLPWNVSTEDRLDIAEAQKILDDDHYDLEDAKERVLEFLAVRKLNPDVKSPILLFVGPPGVGKTSLGRSIARATGRNFYRMSLGGMKDEAEIRGHRRTYVGALPGRIIQGIKHCGSNNPVFMLDEVDKIGQDFRGDPASALLEVLDPEQNSAFLDNYLDVNFDLSKVIFIATANYLDPIPRVLLDRMEMIRLPGYTRYEKVQIARRFLVPKQLENNGLMGKMLTFTDNALSAIVDNYTMEAGVRSLERTIERICRKVARRIVAGEIKKDKIVPDTLHEYLGAVRYLGDSVFGKVKRPGVSVGLAWTQYGGRVLLVEAMSMPGNGRLILTGSLGKVMQESAQIALSYARSIAVEMGLDTDFEKIDIHIHVPEGAIPKDGPSAGITIATSLISLLSKRKVCSDIAMTGELTLRGDVMPIGGLKEKALAAHHFNIHKIIIPIGNKKDIEDVPESIRKDIIFHPVNSMDDVLKLALEDKKTRRTSRKKKTKTERVTVER